MGSDTSLKVEGVTKSFGQQKVLKGISLEIRKGEIFGIVGASGSGKTTLLEIITGNLPPDTGEILYEPKQLIHFSQGKEMNLDSIYANQNLLKRTIGYSPQDPSYYDNLTCYENINLFGKLQGIPTEIRKINAAILLKLVELTQAKDKLAKNLSGGMQKRLDLACSLIHDPKILVLDEPTSDLDVVLRNQMWDLIQKIKSKGTTVIMSSHFLDEIEALCDKIIILNNGKIEFNGSPRELKLKKETQITIKIDTAERKYEELVTAINREYKKKAECTIGNELIITVSSTDPAKDIRKLSNIIVKSKQTLLEMKFAKENITDIFRKIEATPQSPL